MKAKNNSVCVCVMTEIYKAKSHESKFQALIKR